MKKIHTKKGFTLIEMLVVIAIIAVLVAIIIPITTAATDKAKAATDAANLRSVLGQANAYLMMENADVSVLDSANLNVGPCKSFKDAEMYIMYVNPGFIKVFYVDGDNYYGLDYFSDVATNGKAATLSALTITEAQEGHSPTWYNVTDPTKN